MVNLCAPRLFVFLKCHSSKSNFMFLLLTPILFCIFCSPQYPLPPGAAPSAVCREKCCWEALRTQHHVI